MANTHSAHWHDESHEDPIEVKTHGTVHTGEHHSDGVTSKVPTKVVEILSYGNVKGERAGPVKSTAWIVRSIVDTLLSPLERLQEVTQEWANSMHSISQSKWFWAKLIHWVTWTYETSKKAILYPFKVIWDVYYWIGDTFTHLTNGTTNWFWNTGKGIWNLLKMVYWSPTIALDTVKNKFTVVSRVEDKHEVAWVRTH